MLDILVLVVAWFLFTAGMACFGLVFLSELKDTLERGELIDGYK